MTNKTQPLGICDCCLGKIPPARWYTSKGQPHLYCCVECRNTGNSRAGNAIRTVKLHERIARGEWQNPALLHPATPEEQGRRARLGRLREVAAGRWRNPGLTPEAREINARPHKHSGGLREALRQLRQVKRMALLTPEEAEALRAYNRERERRKKADHHPVE